MKIPEIHSAILEEAAPILRQHYALAGPDDVAMLVLPFVGGHLDVRYMPRDAAVAEARHRGMQELAASLEGSAGERSDHLHCVVLCGLSGVYQIARAQLAPSFPPLVLEPTAAPPEVWPEPRAARRRKAPRAPTKGGGRA